MPVDDRLTARRERADTLSAQPLFSGLPKIVWVISILFGITCGLWSVVLPTYRAPDEVEHVSAVLYWDEFHEWPNFSEMHKLARVAATARGLSTYPSLAAEDAPDRLLRATFAGGPEGTTDSLVRSVQHPPTYYVLLATLYHVLPQNWPFDLTVLVLRWVSALILAPLPLLAAALARRLGGPRPVIIAAAIAIFSVPQFAALGGSVNSDNLQNAASAWLLLGIGVVLSGDLRRRTAVWIGLFVAIALLSKAWALPVVAVVGLAYVISTIRLRRWKQGGIAAAIVLGLASLGGWWWVHNLVLYGKLQPAGHREANPDGPFSWAEVLPRTVKGFQTKFDLSYWALVSVKFDEQTTIPVWVATALTLAVLAVLAAMVIKRTVYGTSRIDRAVLLLPSALSFAVLFVSVANLARVTGAISGVQGRYIFAGLVGVVVLTTMGFAVWFPTGLLRWLPLVTAIWSFGFAGFAMLRSLTFHYGPERWSSIKDAASAFLTWSPVPAWAMTLMVGTFAAGMAAVVVALVVDSARRTPSEPLTQSASVTSA